MASSISSGTLYEPFVAYGRSKTANALFAVAFDKRHRDRGVRAVVADAGQIGGRYCENCHVAHIVPDDVTLTVESEGVRGYALDQRNAEALWKKSEELVGESF